MNLKLTFLIAALLASLATYSQDDPEIKTLFNASGVRASGGYGAIGNRFTTINGDFANLVEVYGGWYINHRFLLGVGVAATTDDLRVPEANSAVPGVKMTYQYGQAGLMTEYVLASHKPVHVAFQLFAGGGFTLQYQRYPWRDDNSWGQHNDRVYDENWFFVAEPGVRVEFNVLKWMRFAPGVSYRAAFGSDAQGLKDQDLSAMSVNLSMKFGKF